MNSEPTGPRTDEELFGQMIEMQVATEQGNAKRAAELRRSLERAGWLLRPRRGRRSTGGNKEARRG
jgi:hypothetical protein